MKPNHLKVLAIFARAPQPGKVKSRLAQSIGAQNAVQCYAAFLRDTFDLAKQIEGARDDCQTIVAFTPQDAFEPNQHSLRDFWNGEKMPQRGDDLGARMANCIAELHLRGFERVVLIGSDSPDLPLEFIARAFVGLEKNALVFGPARDGGFYLVGCTKQYSGNLSALFEGVSWSDENTLREVLENAKRLKIKTQLLPEWSDVDTLEDLENLAQRLKSEYCFAGETRRWLDSQNIF